MSRKRMSVWEDTYTVLAAIDGASSIREVLQQLGVPPTSAQYRNAKNFAVDNGIDLPVSVPDSSRLKNARAALKHPSIEDVLVVRSTANRNTVKRLLLAHDLVAYVCTRCKLNPYDEGVYQGVVLQLEHKNGIGDDNRLENLEFLCPTCHTMTPTFASKNKIRYENGALGCCVSCGRKSKQNICGICAPKRKLVSDYSILQIAKMVDEFGINETARKLGVNKRAILAYVKSTLEYTTSVCGFVAEDGGNIVYVSKNAHKYQKNMPVEYPPVEEVLRIVNEYGYREAGKRIGVSDNAVKKFLKRTLGYAPRKHKIKE